MLSCIASHCSLVSGCSLHRPCFMLSAASVLSRPAESGNLEILIPHAAQEPSNRKPPLLFMALYKPVCDQSSSCCCTEPESYVDTTSSTCLYATSAGHSSIQAQVGFTEAQGVICEALYYGTVPDYNAGQDSTKFHTGRYTSEIL